MNMQGFSLSCATLIKNLDFQPVTMNAQWVFQMEAKKRPWLISYRSGNIG